MADFNIFFFFFGVWKTPTWTVFVLSFQNFVYALRSITFSTKTDTNITSTKNLSMMWMNFVVKGIYFLMQKNDKCFVANRLHEGRCTLVHCHSAPTPRQTTDQAKVSLNTNFATILSRMRFRSHGHDNVLPKLPLCKRNRTGTVDIFTSQADKPQRRVNKASYYC